MSYTCRSCGERGHNRRSCPTKKAGPTPVLEVVDERRRETIVVVRCDPKASALIEKYLLEGKPAHWDVIVIYGHDEGGRFALSVDADHVFFVESEISARLGRLKPIIEKLNHLLVPQIVVAIPVKHAAEFEPAWKLVGAADWLMSSVICAHDTVTTRITDWVKDRDQVTTPVREPGERRTSTGVWLRLEQGGKNTIAKPSALATVHS